MRQERGRGQRGHRGVRCQDLAKHHQSTTYPECCGNARIDRSVSTRAAAITRFGDITSSSRDAIAANRLCLRDTGTEVGKSSRRAWVGREQNLLYFDMALVMALAKRLGRPVKYVEDRSENTCRPPRPGSRDRHRGRRNSGRHDQCSQGQDLCESWRIPVHDRTGIPHSLGRMLAGCYKVPNIHCEVVGTYTNTAMVDAYRGAGRPEAAFVIERVCDLVADATGLDPADVRRRNFIQPEDFPYDTGVGMLPYDSGNESCAGSGTYRGRIQRASGRATAARVETAPTSCWESASRPTSKFAASPVEMDRPARRRVGVRVSGKAPTSRCT